jgi:hypothetical protein
MVSAFQSEIICNNGITLPPTSARSQMAIIPPNYKQGIFLSFDLLLRMPCWQHIFKGFITKLQILLNCYVVLNL